MRGWSCEVDRPRSRPRSSTPTPAASRSEIFDAWGAPARDEQRIGRCQLPVRAPRRNALSAHPTAVTCVFRRTSTPSCAQPLVPRCSPASRSSLGQHAGARLDHRHPGAQPRKRLRQLAAAWPGADYDQRIAAACVRSNTLSLVRNGVPARPGMAESTAGCLSRSPPPESKLDAPGTVLAWQRSPRAVLKRKPIRRRRPRRATQSAAPNPRERDRRARARTAAHRPRENRLRR